MARVDRESFPLAELIGALGDELREASAAAAQAGEHAGVWSQATVEVAVSWTREGTGKIGFTVAGIGPEVAGKIARGEAAKLTVTIVPIGIEQLQPVIPDARPTPDTGERGHPYSWGQIGPLIGPPDVQGPGGQKV